MSDCLFCKIVNKDIPADIVYEDNFIIGFRDISPQAPTHVLFIPKKHIVDVAGLTPEDATLVASMTLAAKQVAEEEGLANGYRLVINNGAGAGQSVFHIHLHLLGGRPMHWPPG
jgi:histidine triad (HIT) family protein